MIKSKEVKVYQDRLYCDECGEMMDVLYHFDWQELCLDCIEARLERVEYYDE